MPALRFRTLLRLRPSRLNPEIAFALGHVALLLCACAAREERAQHVPTVVPEREAGSASRSLTAPSTSTAAATSTPAPSVAERDQPEPSAIVEPAPPEAQAVVPADIPDTPDEAKQRARQKQRALALVQQLPEVKAYCREPKGCAMVEDEPAKGCAFDDTDRRTCAWVIAIAHVEPAGPHSSIFARFYVRNDGLLFVEPIQTGELVGLREWRCLQKRGYDRDVCANKR